MPLCPQITNTPITVSLTADFTVTNVVPILPANTEQLAEVAADAAAADAAAAAAVATANAAAVTAGAAQTTANTALANAATAYTTAQNSLQPSAYAIQNPTTKQLTSIDATGLTVYSGASATSGARVVLNSTGLAGFNSGGTATFSVSASTGAAVFAGSVTGATITGGTLNIAGNAIIDASGLLTATGATITGTINATAGYFGTSSNGFSINSTGLIGVGSGLIVGGTIQTSSGSSAVIMNGASNALQFKNGGSVVGNILPYASSGVMMHYGATPDGSGSSYPQVWVGSATASIAGSNTSSISTSSTAVNINGPVFALGTLTCSATTALSVSGQMNYSGVATGAGTAMVLVSTGSRVAIVTSSERFKDNIEYITTSGWLDKVLAMKPITYKTSQDFTTPGEPNETQIGFLAEDIYDLGGDLEKAVVLDPLGEPFSLSYDRLTVFLTLAIKELKAEIDKLKGE
jgi:hypothetical protein